jgi:small GTP-binding protein
MKLGDTFSRFAVLLLAALMGLLLLSVPNWIVSNYNIASSLGTFWGKLYLAVIGLGGMLLFGSAIWIVWKLWGASLWKARREARRNKSPSQLSQSQKGAEIEENLSEIKQLGSQVSQPEVDARLSELIEDFEAKRLAQTLEIVAFGTISSGKSSVLNLLAGKDVFETDIRGGTTIRRNEIPWPGADRVILVDTPGLGEVDGADHVSIAAEAAKDADLVLLVVDGPLRQSEFDLIRQLGTMEKRIIVCLNKSDWYSADDQQKLVGQIGTQTRTKTAAQSTGRRNRIR